MDKQLETLFAKDWLWHGPEQEACIACLNKFMTLEHQDKPWPDQDFNKKLQDSLFKCYRYNPLRAFWHWIHGAAMSPFGQLVDLLQCLTRQQDEPLASGTLGVILRFLQREGLEQGLDKLNPVIMALKLDVPFWARFFPYWLINGLRYIGFCQPISSQRQQVYQILLQHFPQIVESFTQVQQGLLHLWKLKLSYSPYIEGAIMAGQHAQCYTHALKLLQAKDKLLDFEPQWLQSHVQQANKYSIHFAKALIELSAADLLDQKDNLIYLISITQDYNSALSFVRSLVLLKNEGLLQGEQGRININALIELFFYYYNEKQISPKNQDRIQSDPIRLTHCVGEILRLIDDTQKMPDEQNEHLNHQGLQPLHAAKLLHGEPGQQNFDHYLSFGWLTQHLARGLIILRDCHQDQKERAQKDFDLLTLGVPWAVSLAECLKLLHRLQPSENEWKGKQRQHLIQHPENLYNVKNLFRHVLPSHFINSEYGIKAFELLVQNEAGHHQVYQAIIQVKGRCPAGVWDSADSKLLLEVIQLLIQSQSELTIKIALINLLGPERLSQAVLGQYGPGKSSWPDITPPKLSSPGDVVEGPYSINFRPT